MQHDTRFMILSDDLGPTWFLLLESDALLQHHISNLTCALIFNQGLPLQCVSDLFGYTQLTSFCIRDQKQCCSSAWLIFGHPDALYKISTNAFNLPNTYLSECYSAQLDGQRVVASEPVNHCHCCYFCSRRVLCLVQACLP